jgi:hypothetical protein
MLWLPLGGASAFTLNSDEGQFKVELPDRPSFEKLNEKTASGQPYVRYQWLVDQGEKAWIVTYNDYQRGTVDRVGREKMYDNGVDGSVKAVKGTLRSNRPIDHDGVHAREIIVRVPEGPMVMRQRLFIVGDRLYQNIYVGPPGTEDSGEVQDFLASFHINR